MFVGRPIESQGVSVATRVGRGRAVAERGFEAAGYAAETPSPHV